MLQVLCSISQVFFQDCPVCSFIQLPISSSHCPSLCWRNAYTQYDAVNTIFHHRVGKFRVMSSVSFFSDMIVCCIPQRSILIFIWQERCFTSDKLKQSLLTAFKVIGGGRTMVIRFSQLPWHWVAAEWWVKKKPLWSTRSLPFTILSEARPASEVDVKCWVLNWVTGK